MLAEYVKAWDDGWYEFLVFHGRKYVTMIDQGTLGVRRLRPAQYGRLKPYDMNIPLKRAAQKFKERSDWFASIGQHHARQTVLRLVAKI